MRSGAKSQARSFDRRLRSSCSPCALPERRGGGRGSGSHAMAARTVRGSAAVRRGDEISAARLSGKRWGGTRRSVPDPAWPRAGGCRAALRDAGL